MFRLTHKTILYGAAGALGGSAAWVPVLLVSGAAEGGLLKELLLGAVAGLFIGGFIWSHEALAGRQFRTALKRAVYGAAAGIAGGAAGAVLGSTVFLALGTYSADLGGARASLGITLSVALGWALLGALIGMSGGAMIRSRDRAGYGLLGGSLGGFTGGLLYSMISSTNIWSVVTGLSLLGFCIGAFISFVEEAFLAARLKVIKGRHVGREFPILRDQNVIGRDDRSDVCLSGSEGVGMQHALIRRKNGRYSIEADQQGKVIFVNNKITSGSRLRDGDVIRVGSIHLMFTAVRKTAAAVLVMLFLVLGTANAFANDLQVQITQFDLAAYPEVKAYVSILNRDNRPVPGLDKRILVLRENDRRIDVKDMRMANARGNPEGKREMLSMALVLDKSGSMEGNKMEQAKQSLLRFISLMEKGDKASLLAFNEKATDIMPLTDNREELKNAVVAVKPAGHTALYDAIAKGLESVRGGQGRRAVIVLTDGKANRGSIDIDQAIDSAVKAYVSVYVIGLGEDVRTARLERIAGETGGTYFFTPSEEGLAGIYETISRRIRNEYVVTYDTGQRGEYLRKVSVELKGGPAAERLYFQPHSSLFGAGTGMPGWAWIVPLLSIAGLAAISFRNLERKYETGHLSLVRGKGTKKEIDINGLVTIGRDERNTLGLFRDDAVEQHHAEVKKDNGRYTVEDKASSKGTFVNGERVSGRQELRDGDVIEVGETRIIFSEGSRQACAACGNPVRAHAKFCPVCGVKAA
jgi:VWFA-related protein